MSVLKNISIRPVRQDDLAQLDRWRRQYPDAFLEVPHGVDGPGVETAVATKNYKLIGSMTATNTVFLDPLIIDREAAGIDVYTAILLMERALTYRASPTATDSYAAIPDQLKAYHEIVKKMGYVETWQNCTVFRRPLKPDTVPLIENEQTG